MAGYSGKPLYQKLGIKPGEEICIMNAPDNYRSLLGNIPFEVSISTKEHYPTMVHCFLETSENLSDEFLFATADLPKDGVLWISWPKGQGSVINENMIREVGLKKGLVDVKVCAINDYWSGLKFVYRLKNRVK